MPVYLHPGVYVVEISGGVTPIEGVDTSVNEVLGPCLARWHDLMERYSPDLAKEAAADHKVLLLQLIAWAAESLASNAETWPEHGRVAASRLTTAALALLAADRGAPSGVIKRFARFGVGDPDVHLKTSKEY